MAVSAIVQVKITDPDRYKRYEDAFWDVFTQSSYWLTTTQQGC
jgi:hypothetical protein